MKRSVAIADRAVGAALWLVAVANLLFLVAFFAALLFARGAVAEEAACTGRNLLEAMERDDPELLARIRDEASTVENGLGMLWRIDKEGVEPSFLLGTMHMSDPRILDLKPPVREAFDAASLVVIESTGVLDPAEAAAALFSRPEWTMLPGDQTLSSLIPAEDLAMVKAAFAERGIPFASLQKMQPWLLATTVALPACEMARKATGADMLDVKLAIDAKNAGKRVRGLEKLEEQLAAMAAVPMDFQLEGMIEMLRAGRQFTEDVMETMVALYAAGEFSTFKPFIREAAPAVYGSEAGYAQFEEIMINARNRTMAERSAPFIDDGGAFIAVGALHLPGPKGLVALLRDAGYTIEPVE